MLTFQKLETQVLNKIPPIINVSNKCIKILKTHGPIKMSADWNQPWTVSLQLLHATCSPVPDRGCPFRYYDRRAVPIDFYVSWVHPPFWSSIYVTSPPSEELNGQDNSSQNSCPSSTEKLKQPKVAAQPSGSLQVLCKDHYLYLPNITAPPLPIYACVPGAAR